MTISTIRPQANAVLMVRPCHFFSNPQTAASNRFQGQSVLSKKEQQSRATKEFDNFVIILEAAGIEVIQFDDTAIPETPDAIFPNNWVSFHHNGSVVIYPMEAKNRRTERRIDIIDALSMHYNFQVTETLNLTHYEKHDKFLEGTGSMVMDHNNRIIYACRSSRTNLEVVSDLSKKLNYSTITFDATDRFGDPIYHTNVMMSVGNKLAIICLDTINLIEEKNSLLKSLKANNTEVLLLSIPQMEAFAGNMLALESSSGEPLLVMSEQAKESLDEKQIICIEKYAKIISAPLNSIEASAGGSARCMLAEIYLPKKENVK
jgi:hypothetical protein|tara:strand:+ start:4444 stop:5397 length:954 start_codon:yes stop_codon:yes gene_type:complete